MGKQKGKGIGKYQIEKAEKSIKAILKVLSDEKEHRYKDIKKETKLNDPTLTKYLKRLIALKVAKKRVDLQSGEYPYPAYYKAEPELVTWTEATISVEEQSKNIESELLETKDPLAVLDTIHMYNRGYLAFIFYKLKEDKNVPDHKLRFLLDLFVWEPYRVLTWNLIEATKKHIDELDLRKNLSERLEHVRAQFKKRIDNLGE